MAAPVCRDIQGYDVLQTGIGRYKNFNEARTETMARIGRHPVRSVMMRIVVTGGRDFIDVPLLWCRLDEAHSLVDITLLIDGASDDVTGPYIGFDYWSNQWAPARLPSACMLSGESTTRPQVQFATRKC